MRIGTGNGKGTETTCPICGNIFRRRSKGQTFCNKSCAATGRRRKAEANGTQKKTLKMKVCKNCGKEFRPQHSGSVYCTKKCGKEAAARRDKEWKKRALEKGRNCPICGTWFRPKSAADIFCSEECENQRDAWVQIRVTGVLEGLKPEMQPVIGKTYRAKRHVSLKSGFYLIPEIGKYGIVIRLDEAEEVTA